LKTEFQKIADNDYTITKDQFQETIKSHVNCWSVGSYMLFLERLFDAFDTDGNKKIDFREFIAGLSVLSKGTPEEKLECMFIYLLIY